MSSNFVKDQNILSSICINDKLIGSYSNSEYNDDEKQRTKKPFTLGADPIGLSEGQRNGLLQSFVHEQRTGDGSGTSEKNCHGEVRGIIGTKSTAVASQIACDENSIRACHNESEREGDIGQASGINLLFENKTVQQTHLTDTSIYSQNGQDFIITDLDSVVPTGRIGKLQANLEAIRQLKQILNDKRAATHEEQNILARYSGWGQFPDLFNDYNSGGGKLKTYRDELKFLLTDKEYDRVKQTILSSYYTDPHITRFIWQLAVRMGFTQGRILEPSMGNGIFFGLIPEQIKENSILVGVEWDYISAQIAKVLYPSSYIHVKGFEDYKVSDNFYDLVIGNVPFGDYKIHEAEYNKYSAYVHDHFILKAVDKTRQGGLVVLITSIGTLDKRCSLIRETIAEKANLVAAMRFPESIFNNNAGTQVVTDLLILRKYLADEPMDKSWVDLGELPDPDRNYPIQINNYYMKNPDMILGRLDRNSRMYVRGESHVSRTEDFDKLLDTAFNSVPESIYVDRQTPETSTKQVLKEADKPIPEGSLVLQNNQVYRVYDGELLDVSLSKLDTERIILLIEIRDSLKILIDIQLHSGDSKTARNELNQLYDKYVKEYGPIRKRGNASLLAEDPASYLVLALEKSYDRITNTVIKADILFKDVISPVRSVENIRNVRDAAAVCLYRMGKIEIECIADLLHQSGENTKRQLRLEGIAYETPQGIWETSDQYLSGNVRRKLKEAEEAARIEPERFSLNVDALKKAQPEDISIEDIIVNIGVPWIPPSDVEQFASWLLKTDLSHIKVRYYPVSACWAVELTSYSLLNSEIATQIYGTQRANFERILEAALNGKAIKLFDTIDTVKIYNDEESEKANNKVQETREKFQEWLWIDIERATRLHRYYNDNFNNMKIANFSADHYKNAEGKYILPGMNPCIELKPHQIKDIWQAVVQGKLLDATEVGGGKTWIMGAIAMEWKRLGIVCKSAIAVPKARLRDTVKELQVLYPGAKLLSFEKGFNKENRKLISSTISTGDYDMIIVTHEQLDKIPLSPQIIERYIRHELREIESAIIDAENQGHSRRGNRIVKALEKRKLQISEKLKKALDAYKKDNVIYFDETGIDGLLVDEAIAFKSLPVYSRRNEIKGVPHTRSNRATSMFMRIQWMLKNNKGRGIVLASGTPITNTLAELFNIQRYLQFDELEDRGISRFDAWADIFTIPTTKFERKASGKYEPVTRLMPFINMPELQQLTRQVMSVNFIDDMPWIKRPIKREEVVIVPKSKAQEEYMEYVRERVEALKHLSREERNDHWDFYLLVSTDARKSTLSSKLVDPNVNEDDGKIPALTNRVIDLFKKDSSKTQMIFCDLGIKKNKWGYSVYDDIISRLVKGGIPKDKIANFSTMSDSTRLKVSEKFYNGEYIVGIGSTWKCGTGINVQDQLLALHHLDVPWVPAYLEQRNGRGYRQGNMNPEIKIYYYVVEDSFDTVMWTAVARKWDGIQQYMHYASTRIIRIEDTGDEINGQLSPEMIMAASSGNPYELDRLKLEDDVKMLERAQRRYLASHHELQKVIKKNIQQNEYSERLIIDLERAYEKYIQTKQSPFEAIIRGENFTSIEKAGETIQRILEKEYLWSETYIGEYRDATILAERADEKKRKKDEIRLYAKLSNFDKKYTYQLGWFTSYDEKDQGMIFRYIDNAFEQLNVKIMEIKISIQNRLKDIQDSEDALVQPFSKVNRLKEVKEQYAKITEKVFEYEQNKLK